jgi:hypothetical protein
MGEHSANVGADVNKAGFSFRKYVGYICITCGRVCPKPGEHRTLRGGAGCVDFSPEYTSMQPWRELGGEGMRVCQGQTQEERRGGAEVISEMGEAPSQELAGEQRGWKGKDPLRSENFNDLGEIGPHESAFIMKSNLTGMLKVQKEVNERAGLLF